MAEGYRSSSVLINEARLLASGPDAVAAWLAAPDRKDYDSLLELNLLDRNERLIDLALAAHGTSDEVMHQLFARNDVIVRAAILSNRTFIKSAYLYFKGWAFATKTGDWKWLADLSKTESEALFSNPSLPDRFVINFFEQGDVWQALDDDQRFFAADCMCKTLLDRDLTTNFWDLDDTTSDVLNVAWMFARMAPVTIPWAYLLGGLYSKLPPSAFSRFGALAVAERWRPANQDGDDVAVEKSDRRLGHLGPYGSVRSGLAFFAAVNNTSGNETRNLIMNSEDVAIRCGGYREFDFTVDEITSAISLDGGLACSNFLLNARVWRRAETRAALEGACGNLSKDISYNWSFLKDYRDLEVKYKSDVPAWFEGEKFDDVSQDRFLSEKQIYQIDGIIRNSESVRHLSEMIYSQKSALALIFWTIVISMVFLGIRLSG